MKISNASKKVLASALSVAMVVAFAPTVAFGAQDGAKLTVNYSAGLGVSKTGGSQSTISGTETLTVASGKVTLQGGTDLGLKSGDEYYDFKAWDVNADIDKDGKIDIESDGHKDVAVSVSGNEATVSPVEIESSTPLYAVAKYDTASLAVAASLTQATGKVSFTGTLIDENKIKGTGKYVVTAPDGTVSDEIALDKLASKEFSAQVGEWKVALQDGNKVVLDTQSVYVGSITLTGAAFADWTVAGKYATSQTMWYVSSNNTNAAAVLATDAAHTAGHKVKADGTVDTADTADFYTADGKAASAVELKAGAKGAVATSLVAVFASDGAKLVNFSANKYDLSATVSGVGSWADAAAVKEPAKAATTSYYVSIANAKGDIVVETADTDGKSNEVSGAATINATVTEAGTYTITLKKVTAKVDATDTADGVPGKIETVDTKTVEVADDYAAAPAWAYSAKYKADGTEDGGTLVLTNVAGDGYAVKYALTDVDPNLTYDTNKGGLTVGAQSSQLTYAVKAATTKAGATDKTVSKTVKLIGYYTAADEFNDAVSDFNTKTINGKVGAYYADNADVKAAVKAAKKTFTDKGFVEQAKAGDSAAKTWAPVTVAAEQSVVDAVAGVAKAELAKYAAGVASADGKTVSVLSAADYDAAAKAVEAVSAAYAANHDGVDTNNVPKANDIVVSDLNSYVNAVDAGLKAGVKKAESYKAEDVKAAADVTAALKAAKTGDEAKAAIEAYGQLSNEAKKLVATADVAAAQDVVTKAELAEAQDDAAVSKVKGKTVKAKAKKATKSSLKVVKSESGAKSTFKKTSGNSKVKVYKSGKIVVKKGLKAGKKYTVKVKATVGTQTKTVKVTVKVAK